MRIDEYATDICIDASPTYSGLPNFVPIAQYRWIIHRVSSTEFTLYGGVSASSKFQRPSGSHTEDEMYYVIEGEAKIQTDDAFHLVEKGDILFVEREVEHFFDIEADLITLIFSASGQGTQEET